MNYRYLVLLLSLYNTLIYTAEARLLPTQDQTQINQLEQQKAREQQLAPVTKNINLQEKEQVITHLQFPVETPCVEIKQVLLQQDKLLPRGLKLQSITRQAHNQCMGVEGVQLLINQVHEKLLRQGYITSTVVLPKQDLNDGILHLDIVAGKVAAINYSNDSERDAWLYNNFPISLGQALNLRDLEQGLENLTRIPGVEANIQLLPGEKDAESQILIQRQQPRHWRVGAYLDDSGSRYTGRYQGGLILFLDNPFSLSDQFYFSAGKGLRPGKQRGSQLLLSQYSIPWGYWGFAITASESRSHQPLNLSYASYQYQSYSRMLNFKLSRMLLRTPEYKTTLSYDVTRQQSHNQLGEQRILLQERDVSSWRAGLQHQQSFGNNQLNLGISYSQGTRWFGAKPAPTESIGGASAIHKIVQGNASLSLPFQLFNQQFSYVPAYFFQRGDRWLPPQDRLALGGRWSIRGFDGESSLQGDRGWQWRNDLNWAIPGNRQQLYLALDYGRVGGGSRDMSLGNQLFGGGIGLRGWKTGVSYDLFAGLPLAKANAFYSDAVTLGFSLNWQY